jgi:O-antigen/teichoic acid export membrane protein
MAQLIGFQSWAVVIRYGTQAMARADRPGFFAVVQASFVLDMLAAAIAAILAIAGVAVGHTRLGLSPAIQSLAYVYSAVICFNIVGTPTGVLRIFNNFRAFVIQNAVAGILKLVLVIAAFAADGGVVAFGAAWLVSQIAGTLILIAFAAGEMSRAGYPLRLRGSNDRRIVRDYPGLRGFFFATNLSSTTKMLREMDVPLIGFLLGPDGAATFKIGRQAASALNKVIDPFFHAIYPDLARLHSNGNTDTAFRLVRKSALMLGVAGSIALVVFITFGEQILVVVLGNAYRMVYVPTAWCLTGAVIWAFAQPLSPMLMVLGKHRPLFFINLATSVAYLAAIAVASKQGSVVHATGAYAGFMATWSAITGTMVIRAARMHRSAEETVVKSGMTGEEGF